MKVNSTSPCHLSSSPPSLPPSLPPHLRFKSRIKKMFSRYSPQTNTLSPPGHHHASPSPSSDMTLDRSALSSVCQCACLSVCLSVCLSFSVFSIDSCINNEEGYICYQLELGKELLPMFRLNAPVVIRVKVTSLEPRLSVLDFVLQLWQNSERRAWV